MKRFPFFLLLAFLFTSPGFGVDYKNDILPIMKERCWDCHSNENEVKGSLALDDLEEVRDYQIGKYNLIRPGNAEESNFLERLTLDTSHNDFMPRKADRIPAGEIEKIEEWISLGAVIDAANPTEEEEEWVKNKPMKSGGTSSSLAEKPEPQTWTSSDGKEIKARFLSHRNGVVSLLLENGKRADVPESRLDEASLAQAVELASGD